MKASTLALLCVLSAMFFPSLLFSQNIHHEIEKIASAVFDKQGPGGTVLAMRGESVVYRKAFGKSNVELDVDMKPADGFRLGSITKQFTACAILKLEEEGKLSIKDTITKYIKDFPMQGHAITIEQLLTHTSGIRNYTSLTKLSGDKMRRDITPKELIDSFKNEPMDFIPGTQFRYSNSGYILLGYIIELVSGKSYKEYVTRNLFEPAGMKHSFYDNPSTILYGRANGYQKSGKNYLNADFLSMTFPYAAGSLLSNVDDMQKWYQSLINEKIINSKGLAQAFRSYKLPNGKETGYGFGWEVGNIQGAHAVKHAGRINGFVTFALFIPEEKVLVLIFSNCQCTDNLENPASKIAGLLLSKPYQFPSIHLHEQELKRFQGVYTNADNIKKTIRYENGRLVFFNTGGFKNELSPLSPTRLLLDKSLTVLVFDSSRISFHVQSTGLPEIWYRTDEAVEVINVQKMPGAETLEKFVGKYQFSPGPLFLVVKEGNKLYGQVGEDRKELLAIGNNQFVAKDIDAAIIFNMDEHNKVIGLTKIQSDKMGALKIE